MSNTHTTLNSLFTGIASAIRAKKNSTATIVADNFPAEIESLRSGFDYINLDVTTISDYAFYGCEDLKSVDCPNLTTVGTSAFENCSNLETVTLYEGVTTIGENAFKGCDCVIYCAVDSKPDTWHENWNPDGCEVVWGLLAETWDISATDEDNVTAKLYSSIYNDGMYSLIISGSGNMKSYTSEQNIPWYSNYADKISYATIFNGVTSIGENAFNDCTSLTSIAIPDSVTSIGIQAFVCCTSLTSITIPDSVTSIGNNAFYRCTSLTSITIPDSVASIGIQAFYNCTSLINVYITDLSAWCKINFVNSIGGNPMYYGGNLYLNGELLTEIIIPNDITAIKTYAFYGYKSLTSIVIPDSVTIISRFALQQCRNLTSITYTGTIAQWNVINFMSPSGYSSWDDGTGNYTIHCTDGTIAKDGTITYNTTE